MMQIAAQSNAHTLGVMLLQVSCGIVDVDGSVRDHALWVMQKMAFTKVADSHDMHKLTHFLIKEAPFLAVRTCFRTNKLV